LKEPPPSSSGQAQQQREQGSRSDTKLNSSAGYASLIATDVRTGYYKSLNKENRIPGRHFLIGYIGVIHCLHETIICISDVIYEQANASGQSSSENKELDN
jgi:hypothetical protein